MTIAVVVLHDDRGMRVVEVPVDALRRRFGRSKVGGTLRGVVGGRRGDSVDYRAPSFARGAPGAPGTFTGAVGRGDSDLRKQKGSAPP